MLLFFVWLRIRSPPTSHPAFGLPTDQSVMRDQMGSSAKPPPLGFLDRVWRAPLIFAGATASAPASTKDPR